MRRSGLVGAKGKCICNLGKYCQIVLPRGCRIYIAVIPVPRVYHPTVWFCKLKRKNGVPVKKLIHISLESDIKCFVVYAFINYTYSL